MIPKEEKRKIGDYLILNSLKVGYKEIVIGEDINAFEGQRYLCCFVEHNAIFEHYDDAIVSDNYAEIVKEFGERTCSAAVEILNKQEQAEKTIGDDRELFIDDCDRVKPEDCIENKVLVINGDYLRPEFRRASRQLVLCTGGFGAQPNPRGRSCYCINLYDGKKACYYRSDVLGTVEPENLPDWAKTGLERAKEIATSEKMPKTKERDEAR